MGKSGDYLNLLTVQAEIFLTKLRNANAEEHNQIDENLCTNLGSIVGGIGRIINQCEIPNDVTEKVLTIKEVETINQTYICSKCTVDVGQTPTTILHSQTSNHIKKNYSCEQEHNKPSKKVEKQREKQILVRLAEAKDLLQKLSMPIIDNMLTESDALKVDPIYNLIIADIFELLDSSNIVKICLFGPRVYGIGLKEVHGVFSIEAEKPRSMGMPTIKAVLNAMKQNNKIWLKTSFDYSKQVPCIIATHRCKQKFNILFANNLIRHNTQLIEYYFALQPAVRQVCLIIEKWRIVVGLEPLESYGLTLMVIFFFQTRNCLPSVQQLQANLEECTLIGPWIDSFAAKTLNELNMKKLNENSIKTIKGLLKEFFDYYAHFRYDVNIICPYLGKTTSILELNVKMPKNYLKYICGAVKKNIPLKVTPIIVQDPIQLNNNVAERVRLKSLYKLMQHFQNGANLLQN